jgi:hypothetical protein
MSVPNKDEVEGKFDQAKGKVKGTIGNLIGDERMEVEGEAEETRLTPSATRSATSAKTSTGNRKTQSEGIVITAIAFFRFFILNSQNSEPTNLK